MKYNFRELSRTHLSLKDRITDTAQFNLRDPTSRKEFVETVNILNELDVEFGFKVMLVDYPRTFLIPILASLKGKGVIDIPSTGAKVVPISIYPQILWTATEFPSGKPGSLVFKDETVTLKSKDRSGEVGIVELFILTPHKSKPVKVLGIETEPELEESEVELLNRILKQIKRKCPHCGKLA